MSLERKIRLSTLRNYIGILDKHLFRKVDNLMSISYDELSNIILNIENRNYKTGTIKNIYKTIRRFFIYNSKNYPIFNNISLASYPKSMIFDDELDQILDEIENRYKKENLKPGGRVGKNMKNNINIRQSLVLFGRYFGLRRNEARSRLKEDVFFVKYNRSSQECTKKIFVDVNNKGMKKLKTKLKTSNSKRRISACIKNKRHIEILSEFERSIASKTKNDKFIFTEVHHGKIHVIDENVFDWINKIIKEVTSRYCTYHSLRHSFATYTYMDMIRDTNHRPYDMYELSTEMGHATPSMTLNKYIHANLVELM
jgi:integrase